MTTKKDYQLTFAAIEEQYGASLAKRFKDSKPGSAVLQFEAGQQLLSVTAWIGVNNVSMMINKEEITAFLFLIQ